MTYIQIRSWYAYIRPRNARERLCRVSKSILKTWDSDVFCNSAMELILVILKMASGFPLATSFTRGTQEMEASRRSHGDV